MSAASKSQVLNLVEMVNYQDGAVVSRRWLKRTQAMSLSLPSIRNKA
jgi:hypothetical protein